MRGLVSRFGSAIAAALAVAMFAAPAIRAETLTLTGVMTGADHQTYREVPFRVPAGTTAVTVDFAYTGKDQKSVIDLGLRDPQRFRGWSGGNKARFTVTETWATPSYLPDPLPAGEWKLVLGVPNLRKDGRAEYTAKVTLDRDPAFHGFAAAPLKTGPGWYRGDLHLHTQHSDGSCASRSGKRTPCPLFKTLEAAAARGLDFVAMTDHNTTSHFQDLAELQGYYDDLLLIPGHEITTFPGHFNVFGVTAPLDFQLPPARVAEQARALGGLVSINHPGLPSGEACMGCGWTAGEDFTPEAIEVVNGAIAEGPLSGFRYWEERLKVGRRITAVGGSDNHDPARTPGVGVPTTVVRADNLSQDAILAGLRAGQVFIDVQGTRDRVMEVTARAGDRTARMGDILRLKRGEAFRVDSRVTHAAGGIVEIVLANGSRLISGTRPLRSDDDTDISPTIEVANSTWLRVEVRGPDGARWLVGNPIYVDVP